MTSKTKNAPSTLSKVYLGTVEDIDQATQVDVVILDEFEATAGDLTYLWRHFRTTDSECLKMYTSQFENLPPLNIIHQVMYAQCYRLFIQFITTTAKILHIETSLGGIVIRKTHPRERGPYMPYFFTTSDLPATNTMGVFAIASFDA
jgi:hypothetical protein